jgi:hypothetical protein
MVKRSMLTSGPNARVIGHMRIAGPGMLVARARFSPVGAKTAWVRTGLTPFATAWGHQANAHRKIVESPAPLPANVLA